MLTSVFGISIPPLGVLDICLRLLCAMLVGMVIGTEREYTNRPAGMRTHILVALGACSVMITGEMLFAQYSALGATPDPARLGAQVITGVGFLGAGTILREGAHVKGLTTAASLWSVACLGLAAGAGYYTIALVGMGFIFVTLTIFEVLQHKLMGPHMGGSSYAVEAAALDAGLDALRQYAKKYRCDIHDMAVRQTDTGFSIRFRGEFNGVRSGVRRRKFFEALAQDPALSSAQTMDDTARAEVL